ncbi:MAG: hypothetical protein DDT24_00432 [Chloroflexi bacterium]|nr:hypothetical protein [Chloroflexota bacterium]
MSEFIKKLERISREKTQPLGFGGIARSRMAGMMLIAQLPPGEALEEVDALLFEVKDSDGRAELLSLIVKSQESRVKSQGEGDSRAKRLVPWGVRLETADIEGLAELADAGCDYLVFKSDVSARIVAEERMGKVLEVDTLLGDSLARAVGQISVEAILLSNDEELPLSVRRLLDYQRLTSLAGTPVIALLPADISDLEALWGIGVRGVVVDLIGQDRQEKLSAVREAIRRLPASRKKPQERISPILPAVRALDEEFEEEI